MPCTWCVMATWLRRAASPKNVLPLQLLAYHTTVAHGTNVDKLRNLAKCVTAE